MDVKGAPPIVQWMPGGLHRGVSHFRREGKHLLTTTSDFIVDRCVAEEMDRQLNCVAARYARYNGPRPYFDFDHEDNCRAFFPSSFFWSEWPDPGVYASGIWSKEGRKEIEEDGYLFFSPEFYVGQAGAGLCVVLGNPRATLNFGGFTNNPAFESILPVKAGWILAAKMERELAACRKIFEPHPNELFGIDLRQSFSRPPRLLR